MAQEASRAIFLRASHNAESMELPTSASVTEMLAGLGIQANVTEVESAFGQLGLSPTSMLDADMFALAVNFVIPPRGSVLRVNVVKYSTDWYDLWLERYCAAESCSYVYMVRVFFLGNLRAGDFVEVAGPESIRHRVGTKGWQLGTYRCEWQAADRSGE